MCQIQIHKFIAEQKRRNLTFSKKKKKIQDLKEDTFNLTDLKKVTNSFEDSCFTPINTMAKDIDELKSVALDLGQYHSLINDKWVINDNLTILAYYLPHLKAHVLQKDDKKIKKILDKYLTKETNLSNTVNMVKDFGTELTQLESHYKKASNIIQGLSLENNILVNDINHSVFFDELFKIHNTHKELLFHIGKEFLSLSRKIDIK